MRYLAVVILLAAAIAIAAAQDLGPPPYTDSTSVAFEVASVKPEQDRRTWRVVRDAARSVHGVEHPAQSTDHERVSALILSSRRRTRLDRHGPLRHHGQSARRRAAGADKGDGADARAIEMDCGPLRAQRAADTAAAARANALRPSVGREVVDRTNMSGEFDFELQFSPPPTTGSVDAGVPVAPLDDAASVFTALQEQLGLKLESTRGPVELLVIDSAEQPAEN